MSINLTELEEKLGFKLENELYKEALRHSSYANNNNLKSNERLEYVGDAVLDLCTTKYLFLNSTEKEGILTVKRAQIVCEDALNVYAAKLNLKKYLYLSTGEEKSGGRDNKATIANLFEALLGAVFIVNGFDFTYELFLKIVIPYLNEVNFIDYKSKFQEEIQSEKRTLRYEITNISGPSNDRVFEASVFVDDLLYGIGVGKSKKEAEQKAAKEALKKKAS